MSAYREEVRAPRTTKQHLTELLRQFANNLSDLPGMPPRGGVEERWCIEVQRIQSEIRTLANRMEESP
jgi:hypothetical protein